MTTPSKADVLRVAKECGLGVTLTHSGEVGQFIEGANWTEELERFAAAMYAAGAGEMREQAKTACGERSRGLLSIIGLPVCQSAIIQRDRANQWTEAQMLISALPITPTNTEGEQ